ncbi:MFS general substrate transporter [Durotheca rogersii]|uniref:MFS general substrate transporter n=1 Tax=Durotheca rogersii TaxID=419775 RepID=UPI002220130A|nr:MFS general substrate transporter [Durotheca rogersii]KAI5865133.1 MFS general substrate transporter [Durotheca rogersii]
MDETQPLLPDPDLACDEAQDEAAGKDFVDFDPAGDAENPMDWPEAYKWGIVGLLALMAFTVTFTCISVVPVATRIVDDLDGGHASRSASVLLVTIWELGEAAGPLLIAPLSEMFGRYPVMNAANLLFIAAVVLAALSRSAAAFIGARALTGLAVASNVLNPAIVGDMFPSEQRGTAMSWIQLAPLIGGAVGPAISGAIAETLGWRNVLWMSATLAITCEAVFLTCFRETYKVAILRRRAARLRRETGDPALRTVFDVEGVSRSQKLWEAITRPFSVLAGSGVLQSLSVFGAVSFAYFYIMATTLPDILETLYGLSAAAAGSALISFSIGSLVSVAICNRALDGIYVRMRDANKGVGQPEYRLPLLVFGGFALPLVASLYGWTARAHLPVPLLIFTVGVMGATMLLSFLPLTAYVVDAFGLYAASAMTVVIVTRCLAGTFIPLASERLVDRFGYGVGLSLIGCFSLLFAPIPALVLRYGPKWRQRSRYTREAEAS